MTSDEAKRKSAEYIVNHGRSRPSHAIRNDAVLDAAIVTVLAEKGWDDLSVNKVSTAAGLTNGTVLKRFADKTALGVHAWRTLLSEPLTTALDTVITTGLAAESSTSTSPAPTLAPFTAAMNTFIHPLPEIRAALDLVMGSQFDPEQRAAIFDPISTWLKDRCQPDGVDPVLAARATAITIWALGLVIMADRPWVKSMDPAPAIARIHDALAHPDDPHPLPPTTAQYLRDSPFDTGDPRVDTIMLNALESIGTVGYQRTHVAHTTATAGVSESFAFTRFPSKIDLFLAVINTSFAQAYADIQTFRESVHTQYGLGIAEAVTWREYLSPDIADRRIVSLEIDRLSHYNKRMRSTTHTADATVLQALTANIPTKRLPELTGHIHLDFASGHGLPLIGQLLPHSWQLPFNTITTPHTATEPLPT